MISIYFMWLFFKVIDYVKKNFTLKFYFYIILLVYFS